MRPSLLETRRPGPGSQTGADIGLNYVCTTGHIVKDEDYSRADRGRPVFPPGPSRYQASSARSPSRSSTPASTTRTRTDGWLATIAETPLNEDLLDVLPADGILDASAGHGTFVCGVLQQVAPQATIVVYRKADTDGLATCHDIGNAIIQAAVDGANIINLSLGHPTRGGPAAAGSSPPRCRPCRTQYPEVLVVASAGNNGDGLRCSRRRCTE